MVRGLILSLEYKTGMLMAILTGQVLQKPTKFVKWWGLKVSGGGSLNLQLFLFGVIILCTCLT